MNSSQSQAGVLSDSAVGESYCSESEKAEGGKIIIAQVDMEK